MAGQLQYLVHVVSQNSGIVGMGAEIYMLCTGFDQTGNDIVTLAHQPFEQTGYNQACTDESLLASFVNTNTGHQTTSKRNAVPSTSIATLALLGDLGHAHDKPVQEWRVPAKMKQGQVK